MREVAVIGVGQSSFGKFPERPAAQLGGEAVSAALADCGIPPKKIQVAYAARNYDTNCTAQGILKEVGIRSIEMVNVENACAGGATAFRGVWKEIADSHYDIGIAIGVESMTTSPIAGKLIPPEKSDLEGHLGMTMPSMFAMVARRQMEEHGATAEDFAQVSVKNHRHGCLNPESPIQEGVYYRRSPQFSYDSRSHYATYVLSEYRWGGSCHSLFDGCSEKIYCHSDTSDSLDAAVRRLQTSARRHLRLPCW